MHSRWFSAAVVLLWLASMTWLVVEKVLPPLLLGEPPSHESILAARKRQPPVGWIMSLNGKEWGWAVNLHEQFPSEISEFRSYVHFDRLPLKELAPSWISNLVSFVNDPLLDVPMDTENVVMIDQLGRLSSFTSTVRFQPNQEAILLQGRVEGNTLKLEIRSGTLSYQTETYLRSESMLADALSPQTMLPELRAGQRWTVPVYSPLRPPHEPLEILEATVEELQPIRWQGRSEPAWLVVYRSDAGLGGSDRQRGRMWVRRDGTVLRQEIVYFQSVLGFERLPDDQAEEYAAKAQAAIEARRRPDPALLLDQSHSDPNPEQRHEGP